MSRFNSYKNYSYVNMIQDHKEKLQKAIILTVTIAFIDKLSRSAGIGILTLLKEMTYYRVHNTRRDLIKTHSPPRDPVY